MNIKQIIREELVKLLLEKLPKNKWVNATDKDLDDYTDDIINMVNVTYGKIGGSPIANMKSKQDLKKLAPNWELQDVDNEPDADVAIASKKKSAGTKYVVGASDGGSKAKKVLITRLLQGLKQSGNYAELSGAPAHIVDKAGIPYIDDEQVVRKTLKKDITWKGDGWYERDIKGTKRTKRLYGKPKV
jgi:hypothetical protein